MVARAIAIAALERPRRLIEQLLLPRIDLVGMHLIALRQIGNRRLLPQRLQRDLRLQPRIDLPSRPLRHAPLRRSDETAQNPISQPVPKSGSTSMTPSPGTAPATR